MVNLLVTKKPHRISFKKYRLLHFECYFFHESWNIFFSVVVHFCGSPIFFPAARTYLPSYFRSTFKTTLIIIILPLTRSYLLIYEYNSRMNWQNIWRSSWFSLTRRRVCLFWKSQLRFLAGTNLAQFREAIAAVRLGYGAVNNITIHDAKFNNNIKIGKILYMCVYVCYSFTAERICLKF